MQWRVVVCQEVLKVKGLFGVYLLCMNSVDQRFKVIGCICLSCQRISESKCGFYFKFFKLE